MPGFQDETMKAAAKAVRQLGELKHFIERFDVKVESKEIAFALDQVLAGLERKLGVASSASTERAALGNAAAVTLSAKAIRDVIFVMLKDRFIEENEIIGD